MVLRHEGTRGTRGLRGAGAAATLALAATLVLAGCDDEDSLEVEAAAEQGTGPTAESTTEPTPTAVATSSPTPTAAPTSSVTPEEPAEPALAGEECLPGNWFLDDEQFSAFLAGAAEGEVTGSSGTVMVTFREDGTTTTHYDGWSYTIEVDGRTVTLTRRGQDEGTYAVEGDGSLTLLTTAIDSITESQVDIDGEVATIGISPEPMEPTVAEYTCAGDQFTLTADGTTTLMHREH